MSGQAELPLEDDHLPRCKVHPHEIHHTRGGACQALTKGEQWPPPGSGMSFGEMPDLSTPEGLAEWEQKKLLIPPCYHHGIYPPRAPQEPAA